MSIKRPLLAAPVLELDQLEYPLVGSPKLDGIRVICHPLLGPVTRSFKPLPNDFVRDELWSEPGHSGLDGELVTVNAAGEVKPFNAIQSDLMSQHGMPKWRYLVFDYVPDPDTALECGWYERIDLLKEYVLLNDVVQLVEHDRVEDAYQAAKLAAKYVSEGHEGLMLRDPKAPYKEGRSTLKQQILLKYKTFMDSDGIIVGFEELYHNDNPQERDNFGLAKRAHKIENLRPAGTLGALVVNTEWGELRIGTGFDHATRDWIWSNQDTLKGELVTFKYQTHGMQDLPRFPVFHRFRAVE